MRKQNDSLTENQLNKMKELMMNKYLGFIGILTSLILSITLYAYARDLNTLDSKIKTESEVRKESDIKLGIDIDNKMSEHEKLHIEQSKNNELLIKYLDQRFDDMEKLIKK